MTAHYPMPKVYKNKPQLVRRKHGLYASRAAIRDRVASVSLTQELTMTAQPMSKRMISFGWCRSEDIPNILPLGRK